MEESTAAALPTMKPHEAISMLAFCESPWSSHNSDGWRIRRPGWIHGNSSTTSATSSTNDSNKSDTTTDSSVKTVRFSTIEVRCYPITIGDSLCVAQGVPHTIEWDYDQTFKTNVNIYERKRPNQQRRQGEELVLDSSTREKRLRKMGYSTEDLLDAIQAREVARRALYTYGS